MVSESNLFGKLPHYFTTLQEKNQLWRLKHYSRFFKLPKAKALKANLPFPIIKARLQRRHSC